MRASLVSGAIRAAVSAALSTLFVSPPAFSQPPVQGAAEPGARAPLPPPAAPVPVPSAAPPGSTPEPNRPPAALPKAPPIAPKAGENAPKQPAADPEVARGPEPPRSRVREVADLYDPKRDDERANETPRPAMKFTEKRFLTLGADASFAALEETWLVGGEASFVPFVSERLWWLGIAGGYSWENAYSLHRFAAGLEFGFGPLGLEFSGVRFIRDEATAWGGSGRLFLVLPVFYTRTEYAAGCCRQLPAPLDKLRSCGCDRTLNALYFVPYFRLEYTQADLRPESDGERSNEIATFFGLAFKYGLAF